MIVVYITILIILLLALAKHKVEFPYGFSQQRSLRLKGILSVLIVLTHWGAIVVGIFMFMTGYGLYASYEKKGSSYLDNFFKKKFIKLLPPLVIATCVYSIYRIASGKATALSLLQGFAEGNVPIGATWYVYAIIYFYCLFFVSLKFGRSKFWLEMSLMTTGLLSYCFIIYKLGWGAWWWMSSPAVLVGMIYQRFENAILTIYTKQQNALLAGALIICATWFAYLVLTDGLTYVHIRKLLPIYWFITIPIIFVIYRTGIFENRLLDFLGLLSYDIYIVHDMFVCSMIGIKGFNTIEIITIIFVLTFAMAYALNKFCYKVTSRI